MTVSAQFMTAAQGKYVRSILHVWKSLPVSCRDIFRIFVGCLTWSFGSWLIQRIQTFASPILYSHTAFVSTASSFGGNSIGCALYYLPATDTAVCLRSNFFKEAE